MHLSNIGVYNQQTKKSEMSTKKQAFGMAFKPTNPAVPDAILKNREMTGAVYTLFKSLKRIAERPFGPRKLVDVIPTVKDDGSVNVVVELSKHAEDKIKAARHSLDEKFNPAAFTRSADGVYGANTNTYGSSLRKTVKGLINESVKAINKELSLSRSHAKAVNDIQTGELATKTLFNQFVITPIERCWNYFDKLRGVAPKTNK